MLAAAGMLARVFIGLIGLALAPSDALATSSVLIICSGTTGGAQPVKGVPWAAFQCPCAACHHTGCAVACTPPAGAVALPLPQPAHSHVLAVPLGARHAAQRTGDHTRIRAPPLNG
ncbi:hypothetical protein C8N35_101209 [Breoghania corrubedonensis]|uniref:Uncharacterized protein n=2 Tax=Breoghania corrubedonensis TaxID=665038 RepID=A0A2T5VEJ0_9HYPH|nr:hypothetical protein C8N35_101209 [Breoghania corrubedonensis]